MLPPYNAEEWQPWSDIMYKTGWGGETRHQQVDVGGWSRANQGGRYLACCWNLLPLAVNYRAVSIPVTTAVPGLPADRPWFNTQIPPTPMLVCRLWCHLYPYVEEQGLTWEWRMKCTCSLKMLYFDYMDSSVIILQRHASYVNCKVEVRIYCNYDTAANILLRGSDLISCFVNTSLTHNTFISVYLN